MDIIKNLFSQYIDLSNVFRYEYKSSLGEASNDLLPNTFSSGLRAIYSIVKGTKYEIEDQSLMDFLPGYLLIHIDEYPHFIKKLNAILSDENKGKYFPLLVNYSSDFYALKENDRKERLEVYLVNHDELEPIKIYNSLEIFFDTLIECYKEKAYFIDEDGYLDVDFEKAELIGQKLNPENEYWLEE
ncbi:hypothetical protein [Pedobacter gandavensis]|uniref:hypothetical protein n=1 Tax=Pedobacter gandavensis TaxID=2679963 RepID=UPI00292E9896|nr:hypothetical protein [Pedobacter gandavensis]